MLEFRLPDIGEGLTEAEIVDWLVSEGDSVAANQPVVEVETAKTTVEIPAPQAGVVTKIIGSPGDSVAVGAVLFVMDQTTDNRRQTTEVGQTADVGQTTVSDQTTESAPAPAAPQELEAKSQEPRAATAPAGAKAMPIVRKLARERGIDLADVVGTGPGGAVTRADLDSYEPAVTDQPELTPLSSIRRAIAVHMTQSWTTIPHVTVQAEVRAEALLRDRQAEDATLPIEALVARAVMPLLHEYPDFNARYADGSVEYREYINLGFAVDTEDGLMVVVVRNADELSLNDLASEFERLAAAAIAKKATPDELTGQTFTISNIGALGGGHGTPIIPVGTSAIVSIGRATQQPVVEDGELAVGVVAPLDLSYDHRLIDGGLGQRFLGSLVSALETDLRG